MTCVICNHPPQLTITLDCNDIYCFLCLKEHIIKNTSTQNSSCKACQSSIDIDIEHLSKDFRNTLQNMCGNPVWLYRSNSQDGWWIYNIHTSETIENCHSNNLPTCSFFIGTKTYRVSFISNLQILVDPLNASEQPKQRNVKRVIFDQNSINELNIKGIAGLFFKTIEDEIGKFV